MHSPQVLVAVALMVGATLGAVKLIVPAWKGRFGAGMGWLGFLLGWAGIAIILAAPILAVLAFAALVKH